MFGIGEGNSEVKMTGVANHHGLHENNYSNLLMSNTVPFSPMNSGSFSGHFDAMFNGSTSSSQTFKITPFDVGMHHDMMNSLNRNMGFNQPSEGCMLNVPYDVALAENFRRMHVGNQQQIDYCNTSRDRVDPDGYMGGFSDPLSDGAVAGFHNGTVRDYPVGLGQGWGVQDSVGPCHFLSKRLSNALCSEEQVDYVMKLVKEQERGHGYWSQGNENQRPFMGNDGPSLSNGFYSFSNSQQCEVLENGGGLTSQLTNPILELDLGYKLQMLNQMSRAIPNPALPMINTGQIEALDGEQSFILDGIGKCPNCVAEKKLNRCKGHKKNSRIDQIIMTRSSEKVMGLGPQEICENASGLGIPNPLSVEINYRSLADLQGNIYSMSKHQLGCRFLQKVFDEGSDQDVKIVFNEVIDHVVELMMDPFGNYLVQKLLDVCTEEQRMLVVLMVTKKRGELVNICLDSHGTRVVQKLIETIKGRHHISMIIRALKPGLLELMNDLHGNHVVQRCLQYLSKEHTKFIYHAASKFCVDIAAHQNGCCVLNRCISYSCGTHREKLVSSICANGLLLAQDAFGNYVIQYIIELKIPSAAATLLSEFEGHFVCLSTQKFSSHVVEKCLRFMEDSRSRIIKELISVPQFDQLLQDRFANYVIQSALAVAKGSARASLVEAIRPYEILRTSPYCKKIFSCCLLKK